jgi:hypothetical protein
VSPLSFGSGRGHRFEQKGCAAPIRVRQLVSQRWRRRKRDSYRMLVRVKPPSWTGMRVTATFGSSHFAISAASVSDITP